MKFEAEILETDLADRKLIIGMRVLIEAEIKKLSEFSHNNLPNQIDRLRDALEQMENGWLRWQRERVLNLFSAALNIDRPDLEIWQEDDDDDS